METRVHDSARDESRRAEFSRGKNEGGRREGGMENSEVLQFLPKKKAKLFLDKSN